MNQQSIEIECIPNTTDGYADLAIPSLSGFYFDMPLSIFSSPFRFFSDNIAQRFNEVEAFADNWNGYGAKKINSKIMSRSKSIVYELEKQTENISIFPTARGTVQIEFRNKTGDYIEAEIYSDKYSLVKIKPDESEEEKTFLEEREAVEFIK